jgi:hypothetical protein
MTQWKKLADLAALTADVKQCLTVAPAKRPYISMADAVYDYNVGHEMIVVDQSSPLNNCLITVLDAKTLKRSYGISHLNIVFNRGMSPVEVAL